MSLATSAATRPQFAQGKQDNTKNGVAALWYIVKFNLLCSLEESFRVVPSCGERSFPKSQEARSKPARLDRRSLATSDNRHDVRLG